jgi:hypothetical protein
MLTQDGDLSAVFETSSRAAFMDGANGLIQDHAYMSDALWPVFDRLDFANATQPMRIDSPDL